MTAYSAEPWHIGPSTVDSTTIDRDFDVPDDPQWDIPMPARKALDPCGGPPTLLYRTDTDGQAQARITFVLPADDDLADALADLTAVWTLKGPWDITDAEGVTRSVVCDPTQGSWTRVNKSIYRAITIPFQQVG